MEQLPGTYNAGFAISIAIWQGKDYEIKITTKTPLVTMFSGGSGLKDKMENNKFKTSTLFFSVCLLFVFKVFFNHDYIIFIFKSPSLDRQPGQTASEILAGRSIQFASHRLESEL